MEFELDKLLT